MLTTSRFNRSLVITCSIGLVSAMALLPSGSAFALVSGNFVASGSANSSGTSGNNCTVISGSGSSTSPTKAVVGGTVKASTNLNATFQSDTDTNDLTTVSGHYTGVVNVAKKSGDLARLTLTGTGNVSVQRAEGTASHCRTTADVAAVIQPMTFTESQPGWFLATHTGTAKSQLVELEVANSAGTGGALIDIYEGGPGNASSRAFVSPGTYNALAAVGALSGGVLLKVANQTKVSVAFYRAGAAPAGTKGSAKQFVRFPGSVSCGSHSATLTWTSKAGQVANGKFFVNGAQKASASHPHAGSHVTLHHLSATADNKIVAKLSLKSGSDRSATRVYLPCKA